MEHRCHEQHLWRRQRVGICTLQARKRCRRHSPLVPGCAFHLNMSLSSASSSCISGSCFVDFTSRYSFSRRGQPPGMGMGSGGRRRAGISNPAERARLTLHTRQCSVEVHQPFTTSSALCRSPIGECMRLRALEGRSPVEEVPDAEPTTLTVGVSAFDCGEQRRGSIGLLMWWPNSAA